MEERSTSAPEAAGDDSPGQGPQTGLVAAGRPGPGVPVDNSGVRPTFPGRRERTRSRLARLTGRSTATYSPILEPLLRTVRANNPKEDFDLIQRAFVVAEQSHRGQKRKSGDPYITHPVAVATILAELGLSGTTLAAALLHDTVEDTPYTLADLKADFGPEVAMLVDGVTKLDKVSFGEAAQSETVRKMVVAMAKDIRVLMIKLADRLHNARTWRFVSAESSARKARETLEIFAPLAHRLGMNTIKWELEDLSFAALYPKVYEEIVRMVGDRTPEREKSLSVIRNQIAEDLRVAKIKATITGRPKHYYSIYQKMIVRDKDFDDINDLMGVRVLVDSVRDCYAALGTLHSRWNPLPGRFKDYIAMP
ncbi:MAG: diphosphokinase / guanosine-3,5-bis(diphosphate) 3-diphosphatase, partial [Arthrobacter pascens]|nr:diphosphokinase / guanosine-3,5-bis(diphosphate) 3-diphosphatase [Arthrobacter pascens]